MRDWCALGASSGVDTLDLMSIAGQSTAVRTATRVHHGGRGRALVIRPALWTDPLVTFREDPLGGGGLLFYAFETADGYVLECGIGDDRTEALLELHGSLIAL